MFLVAATFRPTVGHIARGKKRWECECEYSDPQNPVLLWYTRSFTLSVQFARTGLCTTSLSCTDVLGIQKIYKISVLKKTYENVRD